MRLNLALGALRRVGAFLAVCAQYGKGLWGSLKKSARRAYRPAAALVLLPARGLPTPPQPFVDHSNPDEMAMSFYEIPYAEGVACTGRSAQGSPTLRPEK